MKLDAMNELLTKQEELDPELAEYTVESAHFGSCIKHPLVFDMMHVPQMNAWVNAQLRSKQKAVASAVKEKEWHSYIFLHERPYRVHAFIDIAADMTDTQYWHNLASIWIDSENIRQNPQVWQHLLRSKRPEREAIMDDEEREALAAMPGLIPVYQGHTAKAHDGWSWTTDRAKAEWFARRFSDFENSAPMLTTGVVYKRLVIAYFTGRGENEIVADRRNVKERKTYPVQRPLTTSSGEGAEIKINGVWQ
jgi:hypothetical protein